MGTVKEILAWSNPLTWIVGIPMLIGIILCAMFDGVIYKTTKVVKSIDI